MRQCDLVPMLGAAQAHALPALQTYRCCATTKQSVYTRGRLLRQSVFKGLVEVCHIFLACFAPSGGRPGPGNQLPALAVTLQPLDTFPRKPVERTGARTARKLLLSIMAAIGLVSADL